MEEVKIWAVQDKSKVLELPKTNVETEQLLENTLVQNPDLLIKGLKLVGRQTPTEGGPLDLLGVDEDGRLVIFELKRGTLTRDAVAQIIDYTSDLDAMGIEGLGQHIANGSGKHGIEKIENFQEWYDAGDFGELEGLLPPRMFLVGLGVDNRTERMVNFLANNSNLDISLLTFQGFTYENKTLLAKQVKVGGKDILRGTRPSDEELFKDLLQRSERYGIATLYDYVRGMLGDNWPSSKQKPRKIGLLFKCGHLRTRGATHTPAWILKREELGWCSLDERSNCAATISKRLLTSISYVTYPKNRDPSDSNTPEVQFLFTPEEWEVHKGLLTDLAQMVYEALEEVSSDDGESPDQR